MPTKTTFLFSQDKSGWSESHWRNDASIAATAAQADVLAKFSIACRSALTTLDGWRITLYNSTGTKSIQTDPFYPTTNMVPSISEEGSPAAWAGWGQTISIELEGGGRKQLLTRGLSRRYLQDTVGRRNDALPFQNGEVYWDQLMSGNWGMMALDESEGNPKRLITAITTANGVSTVTGNATGLAVDDYVRFYRVSLCGFPGRAKVLEVAEDFTSFKVAPCNVAGTLCPGAQFRHEKFVFKNYASYDILGAGKRDVGRPFFLSRGRKPGRGCCGPCR